MNQLSCYTWKNLTFRSDFKIHKMFLNRFLRYFPAVAILVMFYVSSLPKFMVDGPFFESLSDDISACKTNGWSNLLFIQNYIKPPNVSNSILGSFSDNLIYVLVSKLPMVSSS